MSEDFFAGDSDEQSGLEGMLRTMRIHQLNMICVSETNESKEESHIVMNNLASARLKVPALQN